MNNLILSPISFEDLALMIDSSVKNAFKNNLPFQNIQSPLPESDRPLTVKETAIFLDLAVPTIYGLIHKKQIPNLKRGGRLYFIKSDLLKWLNEGKQKTTTEIEFEANEFINARKKSGKYQNPKI